MLDPSTLAFKTMITFIVLSMPALRFCLRVGLPQALVLLLLLPIFGSALFLWIVAYCRWRKFDERLAKRET